jgi:hypothetical protein
MTNKAHSAVVNRILTRYQGTLAEDGAIDIIAGEMLIAVETTATLPTNITQILALTGQRYVAVTNQESLAEALRLTDGSGVGVMDARGEIVRAAETTTQ